MMEQKSIEQTALYLREVEKLSCRQIEKRLHIGFRRLARILSGADLRHLQKPSILDPYRGLIDEWYRAYPNLKAIQIYERLIPYGYQGSYPMVAALTKAYRHKPPQAYHALQFLPGEEAQIDWFFFRHEILGMAAGFVYILSYSRYAWGRFYPATSFEFFLAGHLECFHHLNGLAHSHRYDNLKSVILKREPVAEYNPNFLDFSRHYGFSIHVCNPYKGNEKGRVERLIRDARVFLYGETFESLHELNRKFQDWLRKRNSKVHRTTEQAPEHMLSEERLVKLPTNPYPSRRTIPGVRVSKTSLVEFGTNRYSVPTAYAARQAEIMAYPDYLEVWVSGRKVAAHKRSFKRRQLIQNPLHADRLLQRSPRFKYERIRRLLKAMDPALASFLNHQDNDQAQLEAAYELFQLMKLNSKSLVTAACRELTQMGTFKIKALRSLLELPAPKEGDSLWPQNPNLLHIQYEPRRLNDYDPH